MCTLNFCIKGDGKIRSEEKLEEKGIKKKIEKTKDMVNLFYSCYHLNFSTFNYFIHAFLPVLKSLVYYKQ